MNVMKSIKLLKSVVKALYYLIRSSVMTVTGPMAMDVIPTANSKKMNIGHVKMMMTITNLTVMIHDH